MVLEHFLPGGHPETEKSAGERHDPHPLREANLPFSYFKTMVLEHFLSGGVPERPHLASFGLGGSNFQENWVDFF